MRTFTDLDLIAVLPDLERFAMKLRLRDDSWRDLVHDTIERALTRGHQFEPGSNLRGWLFTIMANRDHDLRRAERRRGGVHFSLQELVSRDEALHGGLNQGIYSMGGSNKVMLPRQLIMQAPQETALEFRDLQRGLAEIRPDLGAIVIGMGFGHSCAEVASALALQTGSVRSRVWRGRTWLRGYLHGQERGWSGLQR